MRSVAVGGRARWSNVVLAHRRCCWSPKSHLSGDAPAALEPHVRFWPAVAFLGFLQVTAAVLNLLPIPGLDGYGDHRALPRPARPQALGNKVKPWGMLGVLVLLFYVPAAAQRCSSTSSTGCTS